MKKNMGHTIALLIFTVGLTGCMPSKVSVRPLNAVIIESAQMAKKSGADSLTIELSVVTAKKGSAEIPISVVTFGVEKSIRNSTKVTAKIDKLSTWVDPSTVKDLNESEKVDLTKSYILDTSTLKLE